MGISATFDAARTTDADKPLKLRYGLWVHGGAPTIAQIEQQFVMFAKVGDPPARKK